MNRRCVKLEIQDMIETTKSPKIIYLNSLHRFGRNQGLEIYRRIKPALYENKELVQ